MCVIIMWAVVGAARLKQEGSCPPGGYKAVLETAPCVRCPAGAQLPCAAGRRCTPLLGFYQTCWRQTLLTCGMLHTQSRPSLQRPLLLAAQIVGLALRTWHTPWCLFWPLLL